MTSVYVLSSAAEADLRDLIRYTQRHWGKRQARTYLDKLRDGIARIAAGEGHFKDGSALYPGLRVIRCEHHYVFFLPQEGAPVLLIAILHERMDLIKRLEDRLR